MNLKLQQHIVHYNIVNMSKLQFSIATKVYFKTFVTWVITFYNLANTWSRSTVQAVLESLQEGEHEYKQKVWKF